MENLAMSDVWADLIAGALALLAGWFGRHYMQPRATRGEALKNMRKKGGTYR